LGKGVNKASNCSEWLRLLIIKNGIQLINGISLYKRSTDEKSHEISILEYFYLFVIIIYAGQANTFVRSTSLSDNVIGYSLPIFLSFILLIKWRISLDKNFYKIVLGFLVYFIALTAKYHEIHLSIFLGFFFLFFIVYALVKVLNINFFIIYESLIFYLALISLGMWAIQTALGGDTLLNLFNRIPGIQNFSYVTGGDGRVNGVNVIIYSVQASASSLLYNFQIPRNCGFAWEPGGFAVYLCLAIYVNLFITNFKKKWNRNFWILLIALLTTLSTTGYSILVVMLLFYFYNKKASTIILVLPVVVIALIFIASLPFMGDKIIALIKEASDVDYIVWKSVGSKDGGGELQRFSSFMICFRDFLNNPILGTGGITGKGWLDQIGATISPISGLGSLMANFGTVGLLIFLTISFRTSFILAKYFNYKGRFLLFILMLFISVSYSIILLPLVMAFWMFSCFAEIPSNKYEINYIQKAVSAPKTKTV
jgi:hypothetical protein